MEPTSVAEFGIATVLLLVVVVTLFAMLLPARRAARTLTHKPNGLFLQPR